MEDDSLPFYSFIFYSSNFKYYDCIEFYCDIAVYGDALRGD